MRYVGQGHEVTVELSKGSLGPDDADRLTDLYRKEYKRLYGSEGPDVPLETITWQLEVSSARPEIRLDGGKSGAEAAGGARKGEREIYLPEKDGFVAVPVYDRYLLEPGATLEGPAVVEDGLVSTDRAGEVYGVVAKGKGSGSYVPDSGATARLRAAAPLAERSFEHEG